MEIHEEFLYVVTGEISSASILIFVFKLLKTVIHIN